MANEDDVSGLCGVQSLVSDTIQPECETLVSVANCHRNFMYVNCSFTKGTEMAGIMYFESRSSCQRDEETKVPTDWTNKTRVTSTEPRAKGMVLQCTLHNGNYNRLQVCSADQ